MQPAHLGELWPALVQEGGQLVIRQNIELGTPGIVIHSLDHNAGLRGWERGGVSTGSDGGRTLAAGEWRLTLSSGRSARRGSMPGARVAKRPMASLLEKTWAAASPLPAVFLFLSLDAVVPGIARAVRRSN
jgi:hypothetical protein